MKNLLFFSIFLPFPSFSQMTTVKGTVPDEKGEPISYARVKFTGTKIGTLTDSFGGFFLQRYYATDSIQVQFIGIKTTTVVFADLIWRMTLPTPSESPFGIRARYALNF